MQKLFPITREINKTESQCKITVLHVCQHPLAIQYSVAAPRLTLFGVRSSCALFRTLYVNAALRQMFTILYHPKETDRVSSVSIVTSPSCVSIARDLVLDANYTSRKDILCTTVKSSALSSSVSFRRGAVVKLYFCGGTAFPISPY